MIDKRLLGILRCPVSRAPLVLHEMELWCRQSGLAYPVRDGIPVLLANEARSLSLDEIDQLPDT
ncbi:MAG: Trm112 family protein [Pseudomonadota bacterium]